MLISGEWAKEVYALLAIFVRTLVLKKNRGYIVSTVMSFVLDICKSLLSALYTYVVRKNSEGPSLRSDFNRLVYNKSFMMK